MTAAPTGGASLGASERGPGHGVMRVALVIALLGALLRAAGGIAPVLEGAGHGFTSAPLLVVLAVVPVAVTWAFLARSRHETAAAVLVGAAVLAPGVAVADLQLAVDPSVVSRPELYLPVDLSLPEPRLGLWSLLAGHVAVALAGLLAFGVLRGTRAESDPLDSEEPDGAVAAWRRRYVLAALPAAFVGACGVLMAPFRSDDVYLLARNAFEGPGLELVGGVLCALALPVGAALLAAGGREAAVVRGGLAGLALSLTAIGLPRLVAALVMPSLQVGAGSVLAVLGAVGLGAPAVLGSVRLVRKTDGVPAGNAGVPGRRRWEVATGVLAVVTGALAVVGASLPQVEVSGEGPTPQSPARWLLLVAGLVLGVLGAALLVERLAPAVRPAVSMAWAGVPLAAAAVLDTVLTSGYTPSIGPFAQLPEYPTAGSLASGPGVLWTWLAMVGAVVTACCSVVAGLVEREDLDEDEVGSGGTNGVTAVGLGMLTPLTAAAVLSVAAFATPTVTAPGYVEAGLWSNMGPPTWGLAVAVLTVVGGCVLAARSRPARAVALLAGAACVVGLRAATVPLVGGEIEGASAGLGLWFSLAAVVALAGCVVIAVRGRRRA